MENANTTETDGAKIRNALSPIKNLCSMLKHQTLNYSDNPEINQCIIEEIENSLKSVEYLSNLLE